MKVVENMWHDHMFCWIRWYSTE